MPSILRKFTLCTALMLVTTVPLQAATETDLQSAFDAMLADPANNELTAQYARVAIEAADYEAAIGALEGLLMMSPDLSRIRADLGILYYRLGSFGAARYHLNRALTEGRLSQGQATRAQEFLVRADETTSRHFFSGRVTGGLRYRSNANSGPDSATVRARGLDVVLNNQFQEDSDGDVFFNANVKHVYDFKRQDSLALESTGFLYANRQFDLDQLNNVTLEMTSGPRWKPNPVAWKGFDWRPHVVSNVVFRDDVLLSNVYGLGMDFRYYSDKRLRLNGVYQHRQRDYHNSKNQPTVEQTRDGFENYFSFGARYLLLENLSVLARVDAIDRSAKAEFNDSVEIGMRLRADLTYASPMAWAPGRWRFFAGGNYRDTDYDRANPTVDPVRVRADREWRFSVGNAIPITGRLQAIVEVSGQFVDSNISNYDRDNISTTVSMSYWF